ncbi:MAG TPA: VWA domain-containing protein [Vicinamibacterales bacterium]|nr:VWA domain-containing protein [Vicinamibacterales bacterium]
MKNRSARVALVAVLASAGSVLILATGHQDPTSMPATATPPVPAAAAAVPSADAAVSAATPVLITSPSADAYISGLTTLRAAIDASVAPESVQFFVDGRQFCTLTEPPFECEWDAGSTVSAHLIRLVVTPAAGARIVRTLRTKGIGYADRVNVEAIQVTVTVTDDAGRFIGGIPRPAFRVFEDGKPQPVTYFASEDVPLELIVAVDISGSMTTSMVKLKKAVKDFLLAVPPKDQVTLLGFNDSVFALTRKTTDPQERVRAVDRLAPWGATALYDVIIRATDMLGKQVGRKALVVFSDGEDQGSHVALEDVERKLQASDVTLYMIAQGRGISQDYLRKTMQRLTVPTGGRTFTTDSVDQLHGAFEELLDELSNQYLLGYQPSNGVRDDTWREIKVEVDGHPNVRARQGYRAAPFK